MTRFFLRVAFVFAIVLAVAPDARAAEPRTYPYDVSARLLPEGRTEVRLGYLQASRTILPNLQLSTHALGWLIGAPNVYAKYRLFSSEALVASAEAGVFWPASLSLIALALPGIPNLFLSVPLALRATAVLSPDWELTVGARYELQIVNGIGALNGSSTFGTELALVRSDAGGAWLFRGAFPIFKQSAVSMAPLGGATDGRGLVTVDDLRSWSVVVSRDFSFPVSWIAEDDEFHLRVGGGYRHTPGIAVLESIGPVVLNLDLYYRTN